MIATLFRQWLSSYSGIPRAVWLLALVNFINRCGSMVLVFMVVYLTSHLHYDIRDAGYVMTCFGLGALAGTYLGGWVTDRWGYYPVQLWTLVLNGLLLLLLMFVQDFWTMCFTMLVMSTVSEAFRPANQVAIGYYSQPENRTRSVSVLRMAFNLGYTFAPALGGILAGRFGWHWMFWADGLTCLAAALALRLLLSPKRSQDLAATESPVDLPDQSPYRDQMFLAFAALTFLGGVAFMQILWTVPSFFKDNYQWSEEQMGLVMALNGLVVFCVEMPLIFRIEGRRAVLTFVRWGLLLYVVSYLSLVLPVAALAAALSYMVLISFGEIFVMPFSSNFAYAQAARSSRKGQYMALYTMAYSLANIVAPLLGTQLIAAWGYHVLWFTVAALSVVTWAGFGWLERRELARS